LATSCSPFFTSDSRIAILDEIRQSKIIEELNLLHTEGVTLMEPTDFSGALKGRSNLYHHLESVINGAEKSLILMTTEGGLARKSEILYTAFKKAKDRGVDIKIIAPVTGKAKEAAKKLSKLAEIKSSDQIKTRFLISDGKELIFTMLDDSNVHSSYDHGVWVNTEFFVGSIQKMFNSVWNELEVKN